MDPKKKDRLKKKATTLIDKYDAKLSQLEAKGAELSADAKKGFDDAIARVRKQQEALKKRRGEIDSSVSDSFDELKKGFSSAAGELKESFKEASRKLKS